MPANFINTNKTEDNKPPAANSGNASNPSAKQAGAASLNSNQLLNEKAEKYLRESGNIEDMPDAEDEKGRR